MNIEHTNLCYKTAEKFIKDVALIEYKCIYLSEEPDVIVFDSYGNTTLYEVKISRPDFWNDFKKPQRIQVKKKRELIYTLYPSLGKERYYVCHKKLIEIDELPEGWGLIWYDKDTDKFRLKKKSGVFKIDKGLECRLLVNALKRYKSGYTKSILLKDYLEYKE